MCHHLCHNIMTDGISTVNANLPLHCFQYHGSLHINHQRLKSIGVKNQSFFCFNLPALFPLWPHSRPQVSMDSIVPTRHSSRICRCPAISPNTVSATAF